MKIDKSDKMSRSTVERSALFSKKFKQVEIFTCYDVSGYFACRSLDHAKRLVEHLGANDCIHNLKTV